MMVHIQDTTAKDSALLRINNDLFPSDPFTAHQAPNDSDHNTLAIQKRKLHANMRAAAEEFSGASRALLEVSSQLAILFHHNQFRAGSEVIPYSFHVAEVGKRAGEAVESFPDSFPVIEDPWAIQIEPKAVAIAIGWLHDGKEDFGENFTRDRISLDDAGRIAEAMMRQELARAIGNIGAAQLVRRVDLLSLNNREEFPDRSYVEGIMSDPYARCVKGADYDHNLESFPGYTETYPLFIVPAQYTPIVAGTLFEPRYAQKLLVCLATYDPEEKASWSDKETKTSTIIKGLFRKYDEPHALDRVKSYYTDLGAQLAAGEFDSFLAEHELRKGPLEDKLQLLLTDIDSN